MSNAKHTRGPWHLSADTGVEPLDEEGAAVMSLLRPHEEIVANALLIAAAPELLEALRGMVALEEENLRSGDDIDVCFELESARAAIAKATGAESSAAQPVEGGEV